MPPVRAYSFTSPHVPRLATFAILASLACSAGDEDAVGSLSAGPYMPGAEATGDSGGHDDSDTSVPDAEPTSGAAGSSTGDFTGSDESTLGPDTTAVSDESTGDAPPTLSCGELAAMEGFVVGACEHNGNGACGGVGTPTTDCDRCCDVCPAGNSCGALAMTNGWAAAACETPGNPACGGAGTPTCDCTVCCEQ